MTSRSEPQFFFIIGAMKAGTTSLYKYLASHPQLYASPRKEPRVFREPRDPALIRREFLDLFEGRTVEPWCFEGSTAYTKYPRFPGVPERLQAVAPDARFVYMVRNPVERLWSQYVHNLAHGREARPFACALDQQSQYLDISRYHLQLAQYQRVFPRDRILVQVFEDMVRNPVDTVRAVCNFLGVDSSYWPAESHVAHNVSAAKRTAPQSLRAAKKLGLDEMLPWQLRRWLRRRGAPLPSKRVELTPELRRHAADRLRPDTEAFFEWLGHRVPAWSDFA